MSSKPKLEFSNRQIASPEKEIWICSKILICWTLSWQPIGGGRRERLSFVKKAVIPWLSKIPLLVVLRRLGWLRWDGLLKNEILESWWYWMPLLLERAEEIDLSCLCEAELHFWHYYWIIIIKIVFVVVVVILQNRQAMVTSFGCF